MSSVTAEQARWAHLRREQASFRVGLGNEVGAPAVRREARG